ncbi:OLC1v1038100C1 [Oldenlandia corymbosa var. corymbosa]|uniref:OLC1v1038100C1 n=1 Tax=Oldenlandia corymbosa var. corymbosa TaxID=529605 RepID=A0AAV1CZN7_OLDCO|nr:OLC1v1038100C1 [Oldenlandia corymbosa var. corymbosa]
MSFKERLLGIRRRRASMKVQIEPGNVIMEKVLMGEKLKFSDRVKAIFREDWEHIVVVSLVGVTHTYRGISNAVKRMWCPEGEFEILDFTNGFFGVLFPSAEEEDKALNGGPWFVGPQCLSVQRWIPVFRGSTATVNTVVTWIRLPNLPVEYYHEIALFSIGNFVSRTLKIDEKTLNADRGKFVRVAVELNLNEPLTPSFQIEDRWQVVDYEGLPVICYNCGCVGHGSILCTSESRNQPETEAQAGKTDE